MALFGLGKKKEEEKKAAPGCCCSADTAKTASGCCCSDGRAEESDGRGGISGALTGIKVLGAGCKSCHELYENAKAAAQAMNLPVEVEYVTDMEKVMEYGVMSMPAIVVNEKVVSMGKVLKAADVEKLLRRLGF